MIEGTERFSTEIMQTSPPVSFMGSVEASIEDEDGTSVKYLHAALLILQHKGWIKVCHIHGGCFCVFSSFLQSYLLCSSLCIYTYC